MEEQAHEKTRCRTGRLEITLIKISEIARRGVATANVRRVSPCDDAFGGTGFAGNNQIVTAQVELFHR